MSSKLHQSLDEIVSSQRRAAGTRRRSARRPVGRPATTAPVGGVQKTAKPARGTAAKPTPARAAGNVGESKIIVSNMPKDVSEGQIKEYFSQAIGQVKKVEISYGPGGVSRGIANVIFHTADGASKAFQNLNGLLIDNRPVKVEVVVANADLIPQPKTLSQRISNQPKAQPKSAAAVKTGTNGAKTGGVGKAGANKKGRRPGARNPRPSKKTQEELDSEMADYWGDNANAGANTGAAPAGGAANANADAPMDDEIL